MSATVEAALYGYCHSCCDASEVGVTRAEAEAWISQHNSDNHSEDEG